MLGPSISTVWVAILVLGVGSGDPTSVLRKLAGSWTSVGTSATITERWSVPCGGRMVGVNRTVAGGEQRAFEFMRIEPDHEGTLQLVAHPSGVEGTSFRLTSATEKTLTFENSEHDFPNRIVYAMPTPDSIEATISGPDEAGETQRIVFRFVRLAHAEDHCG